LDLYYRLAVVKIEIPALRERRCDIEPLVRHLVRDLAEQMDCEVPVIEASALLSLEAREWPGNVRELRNALEHAMVIGEDRARIRSVDLPEPVRPFALSGYGVGPGPDQKTELLQTIRNCGGIKADAARQLNISRTTLYRRLKRASRGPAIA
jgi:DNA-binding NtrC family response regulator